MYVQVNNSAEPFFSLWLHSPNVQPFCVLVCYVHIPGMEDITIRKGMEMNERASINKYGI